MWIYGQIRNLWQFPPKCEFVTKSWANYWAADLSLSAFYFPIGDIRQIHSDICIHGHIVEFRFQKLLHFPLNHFHTLIPEIFIFDIYIWKFDVWNIYVLVILWKCIKYLHVGAQKGFHIWTKPFLHWLMLGKKPRDMHPNININQISKHQ